MMSSEQRLSPPDITTFPEIVDLRDAKWFFRRHWKIMLLGGILGITAGFAWTYFFPPRYHSEARVRFMPPQLAGRFVNPNFSMEVEQRLFALAQLLSSRLTATRMIESYYLYPERRRFQTVADLVPNFASDLSIDQIASGENGQRRAVPTLSIHFRYPDPVQAQKVVQKLVEQVYEENRKYRGDQSMGTTEFLADQLRTAEEKMLEAEARLGEVQDAARPNASNRLIGEGTSRSYVVDSRLRDLRHDRRQLEERRSIKQAEVGPLEAEIRSIDGRPVDFYFPQVDSHINYWHLYERVSAAKMNAARMRDRWRPGFADRELAELDLQEAEKNLQMFKVEQSRLLRAQDRERVVGRLLLVRNELRALEAQEAAAHKEELDLRAESQRLKDQNAAPAGMETDLLTAKREYETAKEQHLALVRKHEESQAASDMERRGQGEIVELLEPASLPTIPEAPGRWTRIAASAIAGLSLGIFLCLLKVLRDPKILHEGHLEKWAGLEVLAMFPPIPASKKKEQKPSAKSGGGKQSWRRRAVTTALLIFALFGSSCTDRFLGAEALWKRGQAAEKESSSSAALLFYRQAIRKDPRFAPAYRSAGLLALQIGELGAARDFLTRSIEFDPNDPSIYAKLADITYQLYSSDPGRPMPVLREIESLALQLETRWPRLPDGYRVHAQVLMERHRTEEAVEFLHEARNKVDNSDTLDAQAAAALVRLGRNQEAETLLREVIGRSPSYTAPYDLLYLQLMQQKDPSAAREVIEQKWSRTGEVDAALQLAAHDDAFGHRDLTKKIILELENAKSAGPMALARIGDFWMMRGEFAAAHDAYQRGRAQFPQKATEYISRIAEWYLAQNQQKEARQFIATELTSRPKDPILLAYASAIALNVLPANQREAERRKLESIANQIPDAPFVRYHLGRALLMEGMAQPAAEQFERCVKLDPNYSPGWVALAELEIARGNPAAAEQRAENVLRVDRNNLPAILVRARAQITRGKPGDAEKALDFLLSIQPGNTEAIYLLAAANRSLNRPAKSLELLEKGHKLNPENPRWVIAEADVAASQGDIEGARAKLTSAAENDLIDEPVLVRLAALEVQQHDGDAAVRSFERLRKRNPGSVEYRLGFAGALALAGKTTEANAHYTELEKLYPQNANIWLQHAALLSEQNDKPGALAKYQEALSHDKNNPLILNNLAWTLLQSGGPAEKALEYAQQARRLFGRSQEIDDTLAAAYSRLEMFRNASAIYEEMLTYLPPAERPRVQKLLETAKKKQKRGDA